jgi:hypothetical protein
MGHAHGRENLLTNAPASPSLSTLVRLMSIMRFGPQHNLPVMFDVSIVEHASPEPNQ